MSIKLSSKNKWNKTTKWMRQNRGDKIYRILKRYGEQGVRELAKATPKDTGLTANSWSYNIIVEGSRSRIEFTNSNILDNGMPLVLYLEYGHGTKNGGYVAGKYFIKPTLKPIFEKMANDAWKEVTTDE